MTLCLVSQVGSVENEHVPAQKAGGLLYLGFGVTCQRGEWLRRERPSGLEARSENSLSLFCRSAPRPNFLKLKRITGLKSLH
jgi:hypothetical protein